MGPEVGVAPTVCLCLASALIFLPFFRVTEGRICTPISPHLSGTWGSPCDQSRGRCSYSQRRSASLSSAAAGQDLYRISAVRVGFPTTVRPLNALFTGFVASVWKSAQGKGFPYMCRVNDSLQTCQVDEGSGQLLPTLRAAVLCIYRGQEQLEQVGNVAGTKA